MLTVSWVENLKERDHSEDLRVDEKIILEWVLGKLGSKEDKNQWRVLENTVINLGFHKRRGIP
jgi:hypothetical protein